MRRSYFLAWMLALFMSSGVASAVESHPANATELARQRFQEAAEAYQEGRYSAAASLFEAADRLVPHASTRYNAATAWEQAGEDARAATGYEAALALDTLDASRREAAQHQLAGLKQKLARIHIQEPLGALITVDHVQGAPVPVTFYLRPGSYQITVEYRDTNSTTDVRVAAGQDREIALTLPPQALPPPPAPPAGANPTPPERLPVPSEGISQKTWGWVGIGASVALSGAAIVLGVRALSTRDRYRDSGYRDAGLHDQASDLRLATNLLWGGATLAGATGLVLLLTAPTVEF
jgi:tetratricopeptide (TPR) repeat protein